MGDDDLLLDASDLADIFGSEDEKSNEDFAKSIEDLFLSDDEDEEAAPEGGGLAAVAAPVYAAPPPLAVPVPEPVVDDEPEPEEPDRGGLTEEEWRASPAYGEFKKQVIARHLRKKAAAETAKASAEARALQDSMAAQAAAENAAVEAAKAEAEKRKQELLDKYKAAKAGAIAQRAQAMVDAQDQAGDAVKSAEVEKEAKLKGYLADLKAKVAAGGMPQLSLQAKSIAPKLSEASHGLDLDVVKSKLLASMFEEARSEMLRHVSDAIGKKPAQAMMKKTLAKVAKLHLDIYGRAAVDSKNELRVDGQLDEDKLARAIYGVPADRRLANVQKAFYELIEMRFIACELGLGNRQKDVIVSKTLHALEASFAKKGHPKDMVKWFFDDVVPSTTLADSDDSNY